MKQKRLPFLMASMCLALLAIDDALKHMSPNETLNIVHVHVIRWSLVYIIFAAILGAIFPSRIRILQWGFLGIILGMLYTTWV
jgi:hypothetical protein